MPTGRYFRELKPRELLRPCRKTPTMNGHQSTHRDNYASLRYVGLATDAQSPSSTVSPNLMFVWARPDEPEQRLDTQQLATNSLREEQCHEQCDSRQE